jgi:hypothetical protein
MLKTILNVNPEIYFRGLEEIKNIELLDNGVVLVHYTITDKWMEKCDLYHKNRILEIDTNERREILKVKDYANNVEGK